ncbi:LysR family transcriptional regulator [Ochrobactrum pseudogrignonense]|nr:LysR family transcriptional regulator [Brucella pseudogrignonensis]
MDIDLFEDFIILADELNFSAAAARRNVTQPAFSRRIQMLEQWIGAPLLSRTSRSVTLTQAGRVFYTRALSIVRDVKGRAKILAIRPERPNGAWQSPQHTLCPSHSCHAGCCKRLAIPVSAPQAGDRHLCRMRATPAQRRCGFLICHRRPETKTS